MRRLTLAAVALLAAPAAVRAQFSFAQSFTAPAAPNTQLLTLTVGPGGISGEGPPGTTYVANLFAFDGAALVGPNLFVQELGPVFRGFTLAPDLTLLPGATYAIAVANAPGGQLSSLAASDVYADGVALFCTPARVCTVRREPNDVAGFAVTFGPAPAVVPEPAPWALVGVGLAGVAAYAGVARRRIA